MEVVVPLIDSGGMICVYVDARGRLTLPSMGYDEGETTVVAVARYLSGLGWDWSDLLYLGPFGINLPDGYFQIIQDGAQGWAPAGLEVIWMPLERIRDALNAGRFTNPTLADRAVSLLCARTQSPLA